MPFPTAASAFKYDLNIAQNFSKTYIGYNLFYAFSSKTQALNL